MESLELLILKSIFNNREYADKVVPFLDETLFENYASKNIVKLIRVGSKNKGELITLDLLKVGIDSLYASHKLTDEQESLLLDWYDRIRSPYTPQPIDLLIKTTEDYFRKRMSQLELRNIMGASSSGELIDISSIRKLEDSVNFTFDGEGYYNYLKEFKNRLDDYEHPAEKYPFPLAALNDCTNGGMNSKSLTIAMASTGGGKSIFLCNCASYLIRKGYNVLYVTCEMSVQEIAKRIDADLLSATQDSIMQHTIEKRTLEERMDAIDGKDKWGQLFIKEYPAGFANAGILRRDLEEIERKNEAKVDVLVLDYLNLLSSTRYSTKNSNTYVVVKAVAEEVRGLGQTFEIPVISATQSNRSALNKEIKIDAGMEAVSDSYGLPQTCDFMFNIIQPDDLEWKSNRFRLLRILKNRWGDPSKEFIKVKLDTRMARFSDVPGFEKAIDEKPTELCNNFEDRSNGVLDKVEKKSTKEKQKVQDQQTTKAATATQGNDIF